MTRYSLDLELQRPRCFHHLLSANRSRPPCSLTPCPGLLPTAALQCTEQGPRGPLTCSGLTPHVSKGTRDWLRTGGHYSWLAGGHPRSYAPGQGAGKLPPLAWRGLNNQTAAPRVVEEPGEMASPSGSLPCWARGSWWRESGAKVGPACLGSPSVLGTLRVSLTSLTRP